MSQLVFFSPSRLYCSAVDIVTPEGVGRYSGKTLADFQAEYGDVSIVDSEVAVQHDRQRRITAPVEIDAETFNDLLEVLPPCKWRRSVDAEAFHISERITYDIVTWVVRVGQQHWRFDDTDRLTPDEAINRVTSLEAA